MRWKKVHFFVALAFFFVALAFFVYALTSVVYNDQADFDSGTYNRTQYSGGYLFPNVTASSPFEVNQSESGTINMSGNQLLAYFDETAADTLAASEDIEDFSSNDYHGEDFGTVSYGSTGLYEKGLDLTSNGGIDFGDIEMDSWGEITVSIWVNRTGGSGGQRIVSKDRLGTPGNFIFYFDDDVLTLRLRDGGGWETLTYSPSSGGIDGEWHQTGFTADESTNTIYLYWDGEIVDTVGGFAASTLDDSDNEEVVVGADSNVGSPGDYFTGYVDDFAIWDRALSETEVRQIYSSTSVSGEIVSYTSDIEDAGSSTDWQSLMWFQDYCYGCDLPDNSSNETSSWFDETIDMDQNIFLYHFDESNFDSHADSTDFYDSSGNYLHANSSGSGVSLLNSSGKFGGAINLSSDANGVEIGYLNFSNVSDVTMSLWFKTDVTSGILRLFSKDRVGTPGAFIQYFEDSNSEFRVYDTTIGNWRQVTVDAISYFDDEWHHRVDVIDTQNDLILTYIDGVEIGNDTFNANLIDDSDNENLALGVDSNFDDNSYAGFLDEAVMWARALSAEEIAALYHRGYDSQVNFSVQSCNDVACSGESFVEFSGDSPIDISSLSDNQYIQFEVNLTTVEEGFYLGPRFYNVTLTDQVVASDIQANGNSWAISEGSRAPSEDPGAETPAVVLLDSPVNGTSGTDRSFEFIWNNSATANVTYDLQVSTDYHFESAVISASGLSEENSSQTNYSTTDDLPIDDVYYWRVRAVNGITPGDWSEVREVEVLSYLAISLPGSSGVDFGNLFPGQSEDTETTAGLQPIIIRNDGNYPVNITVNASSFFVNSDGAYQFKIEDNETGSYDSAFITYTDLNSSAQQAVTSLNYENSSNTGNTVNMHLTITVPSLEPAADKTSLIEISTG